MLSSIVERSGDSTRGWRKLEGEAADQPIDAIYELGCIPVIDSTQTQPEASSAGMSLTKDQGQRGIKGF